MTPTDQQKLPHRLREASFRRYEATIAAAIAAFPSLVEVDCQGLSPVTVAARLRDAKLSLETYKWKTSIDVSRLTNIEVSHRDSQVFIGGRHATLASASYAITTEVTTPMRSIEDSNPLIADTAATQSVLCDLAARRLLVGPIRLIGLTVEDAVRLEQEFDCSLTKNNDGSFTLV